MIKLKFEKKGHEKDEEIELNEKSKRSSIDISFNPIF